MIITPNNLCIHLPAATYLLPSLPRTLLVTVHKGIIGIPCPRPNMNNSNPPVMIAIFCESIRIKTGIIRDIAHGAHPIENKIPKKKAPK